MFGYFSIIDHSSWLDNAFSDIPDGIKQLLHVLTAVNMRNKHILFGHFFVLLFVFFPFSFFLFFVFFLILSYRDCLLFLLTFLLTHDTSFDIWMPGYLVYLLIYSEVHINRLLVFFMIFNAKMGLFFQKSVAIIYTSIRPRSTSRPSLTGLT